MNIFKNQTYDKERAFYGYENIYVQCCAFDGPADGESAFKECKNVSVKDCFFNLRYPFWHNNGITITSSEMTEQCRAALWYSTDIEITDTKLHGIKALRECSDVKMENCSVISPEFGWFCRNLSVRDCEASGEYAFLRSSDARVTNLRQSGKYSFQYIENFTFENCSFDTKDAFWHGKNITLKNCTVKGEYLGWYSENITFINCKITGTQPLCYCKGLKLINCEMQEADLAFERSEVEATLTHPVISIKNPRSGIITVPEVEELIFDDPEAHGAVKLTKTSACKI